MLHQQLAHHRLDIASAHLLGQRIGVIAISQRIRAWYRETVDSYELGVKSTLLDGSMLFNVTAFHQT